ncbi:MAG: HzsA-related protein, partial [Planctomycetota bacterium]
MFSDSSPASRARVRARVVLSALSALSALFACGVAGAAGDGAHLQVSGTRSLAIGTFADGALINTNRDYAFGKVPETLKGLNYTSHEHKAPSTVDIKVKRAGKLYVCLTEDGTLSRCGIDGGWKDAGEIQGSDAGKKNRWRVYRGDVKAGSTLTLSSPNKWGVVVAAGKIEGAPAAAKGKRGSSAKSAPAGPGEYSQLEKQLRDRRPGDGNYRKRMEALAKQTHRAEALLKDSDRDPLDVVLRRTEALLKDLTSGKRKADLRAEAKELAELRRKCGAAEVGSADRAELFKEVCKVRRRIAFGNPLVDFDKIAFIKHNRAKYNHMCDQYFGFHANPGGGVYVLENAFGEKPIERDVLADSVCRNGRFKGKKLTPGSFMSLDLSYDGKTLLFAYTEAEPSRNRWTEKSTYHIFKVNVDGSGLTQLTDGKWNDFDPCWMPDGKIAFISERRGGFGRCHGRPVPTYTLHSMNADGSDLTCISFHETNEWHPSVDNNGMIVYTRWDYVDRDSDVAHHIWLCYPDGRDPRSYHGNYPVRREFRPWMEMSIRAIPDSPRYISTSAPHHGQAYGSLVLIDQGQEDDDAMSQVKRLTPEVLMPESETASAAPHGKGRHSPNGEVYGSPWPLSEDYYVCVYDPARRNYGISLVDSFGNKELIYRDGIPCLDPIPLRPRKRPRAIPAMTRPAARKSAPGTKKEMGTVVVMNVYDSDFEWPKGAKVKSLRIVQLYPKATANVDKPRIGAGDQSLARGVLGTVPVEPDGSANFEAPVGVPIYFQALDENGMAIQSMRSDTYLHPGE